MNKKRHRTNLLLALSILFLPSIGFAQKLPGNFNCQDLIDAANGKLSRSTDGGITYVPINVPQPKDAFDQAMLSHDTHLCHRLAREEITVDEFNALHDEKALQLRGEKAKVLTERQKVLMEEKALQNQQRALQNQQAVIETQKEAVQVQRQSAVIQALQAEAARKQEEAHHQDRMRQQRIQQQQLEQIRQEQSRPKTFSCFGGGAYIHCN